VGFVVTAYCRLFHVPCGTVPVCVWYGRAARVDGRPHDALRKQQLDALQCSGQVLAGSAQGGTLQLITQDSFAHVTCDVLSTD
jgi:hypothetical protein